MGSAADLRCRPVQPEDMRDEAGPGHGSRGVSVCQTTFVISHQSLANLWLPRGTALAAAAAGPPPPPPLLTAPPRLPPPLPHLPPPPPPPPLDDLHRRAFQLLIPNRDSYSIRIAIFEFSPKIISMTHSSELMFVVLDRCVHSLLSPVLVSDRRGQQKG